MGIGTYTSAATVLRKGGATWRSIAMYPLRRRLSGVARIDLRDGSTLVTEATEPLFDVFREVFTEACYAVEGVEIGAGDHIVDIGANAGVFALWAARRFPQARIVSVEPNPITFRKLEENARRNRLQNVTTLHAASAGKRGRIRLYVPDTSVRASMYRRSADNEPSSYEVEAITLDELFEKERISRCAFLKLDCEGAEYEILLNASASTLRRVAAIALEYHLDVGTGNPDDLRRHLTGHGFSVEVEPENSRTGYLRGVRQGGLVEPNGIEPSTS